MPDWEALVCKRLAGIVLEPEERCEVISELAGHLEETFEQLRGQGVPAEAAVERALSQVKDWQDLRRKIQIAKRRENVMSNRVRQLWLPGLITLALSMGFLAVIQKIGPLPLFVHRFNLPAFPVMVVYVPWLVSLPLVGVIGAYMSDRAGGSLRTVFFASVFPVLPYAAFLLIGFPVSLAIDKYVAHNIMPAAFLGIAIGWVVIPGVALLTGGLPAHLFFSRRLASRGIASR